MASEHLACPTIPLQQWRPCDYQFLGKWDTIFLKEKVILGFFSCFQILFFKHMAQSCVHSSLSENSSVSVSLLFSLMRLSFQASYFYNFFFILAVQSINFFFLLNNLLPKSYSEDVDAHQNFESWSESFEPTPDLPGI